MEIDSATHGMLVRSHNLLDRIRRAKKNLERVKRENKCTCSSFALQYEGKCVCAAGYEIGIAEVQLQSLIDQI